MRFAASTSAGVVVTWAVLEVPDKKSSVGLEMGVFLILEIPLYKINTDGYIWWDGNIESFTPEVLLLNP